MAGGFSGAVKVTDASDFVEPASSCALGLDQGEAQTREKSQTEAEVSVRGDRGQKAKSTKTAVQVSLQDCLACAGCVTSAETVLLAQQSTDALIQQLQLQRCAVSISEASRSAIAHAVGTNAHDAALLIRRCLRRRGAIAVLEQALPAAISRLETLHELDERTHGSGSGSLPLLVSACPGWTCYAEASQHAHAAVPHLSQVKSPTGVAALLACFSFGAEQHITVEPCYDKKLETARSGVNTELSMTTSELLELMQQDGFTDAQATTPSDGSCAQSTLNVALQEETHSVAQVCQSDPISAAALGWRLSEDHQLELLSSARGGRFGTSGAYALSALAYDEERLKHGRNADLAEGATDGGHGVAIVWGLRNVQTLLRQVKKEQQQKQKRKATTADIPEHTKAPRWSLVEVMACPSGCLNGGGQPRPRGDSPLTLKAYPSERLKHTQPPEVTHASVDQLAYKVAHQLLHVEIGSTSAKNSLRLPQPFEARKTLADGSSAGPAAPSF